MRLQKIDIAGLKTPNNVFLAPLAGYTNGVFRQMCYRLGAGLTFTEMVSAKGLCYGSENTRRLLALPPDYAAIKACQIFGSDPEYIRRAVCSKELEEYELIDLNMGCPVPKIFKNGEGSALLANIPLAQKIVAAAKSGGKRVSVKFRIGLTADNLVTRDFAVAMQDAGADMITVHGRTRDKIYSGEVNCEQIALAKQAVTIPVIANGGIFSVADADALIKNTGADGVMLARGAMYNPFLFAEICGVKVGDKRAVIAKQLKDTYANYDSRFATVYMRKMIAFYIKGLSGAAALRVKLMQAQNMQTLQNILNEIEF